MAGGCGSHQEELDVVEVLLNNQWTAADSLPIPCRKMRSTFHEGNFYFTGGAEKIIYICSLESLIASASNGKTRRRRIWRTVTTPISTYAIASYISNLISINEYSTIRSYSNYSEKWIETTSEGDKQYQNNNNNGMIATAFLSTGQLVVARREGVYKATLSG